ncbi:MAG: hypothetical protein UD936_03360 [Acutalibacteraceae bacterium]|nr:hypothetical protein [Acutalibacteraceae bacterium]
MSRIIEEYYTQAGVMPLLIKLKLDKLSKHPDITEELESWITTQEYRAEDCVEAEGYTAKQLSELSEYLDGEGAFMLLIELREDPENALEKISDGFKMK